MSNFLYDLYDFLYDLFLGPVDDVVMDYEDRHCLDRIVDDEDYW
jgi:hypothetical protein